MKQISQEKLKINNSCGQFSSDPTLLVICWIRLDNRGFHKCTPGAYLILIRRKFAL